MGGEWEGRGRDGKGSNWDSVYEEKDQWRRVRENVRSSECSYRQPDSGVGDGTSRFGGESFMYVKKGS